MAYEAFAGVYDALNEDANYDALFCHLRGVLNAHGIQDGIVADLGCGTGELTLRLAGCGYDMIGVDRSSEMLSILREKAWEQQQNGILLLCQDLTALDLYGTVRAAVSTFDTLNHIGPLPQLRQAVRRAALFLEPGGIFVFDLNTPYKHRVLLADNIYEIEADDAYCIWRNQYDSAAGCTHISIEISYPDLSERDTECFDEYCYTLQEITDACADAGLHIEQVVDGEDFGALRPDSARYLFTAVKERMEERSCQD